jgi:hypothetical protein
MAANAPQVAHTGRKVATATQALPTNTVAQVLLPSTDATLSRGAAVDTGTANALVAKVAGVYRLAASVSSINTANRLTNVYLYVNGAEVRRQSIVHSGNANAQTFAIVDDLPLSANDVVTLYALSNTANSVIQVVGTWMTLTYIGP